ncbi:MAG: cell division protein ZapE, partial [Aquiluna sp.]
MRQLVPPPEFDSATFDSYRPDPEFPSQQAALKAAKQFATGSTGKLFGRGELPPGVYLDGGFGVGKTHLLASIWHEFRGKKAFGTFLEYTSLVGFLGFQEAVRRLSEFSLVCIDEFELDDPGDTMILSRLLKELAGRGVKFAATSNTPPNALGEGRFAAEDFARVIAGLGERFQVLRIDGEDYRHRDPDAHASILRPDELLAWATRTGAHVDNFQQLLAHLATLHPTKFRK